MAAPLEKQQVCYTDSLRQKRREGSRQRGGEERKAVSQRKGQPRCRPCGGKGARGEAGPRAAAGRRCLAPRAPHEEPRRRRREPRPGERGTPREGEAGRCRPGEGPGELGLGPGQDPHHSPQGRAGSRRRLWLPSRRAAPARGSASAVAGPVSIYRG